MSLDVRGDAPLGFTQNGFAAPARASSPAAGLPWWRRRKALAVAGSACAIGLVVGLWAKPQFGADGRDRAPMKPVAAEPLDGAMQIVVDPPKTEVVAAAPGQLEVLPPDMAAAAAARRAIPAALPARQVQPEIRPLEPPPAPRMIETRRPAPAVRPSFDCRDARTEAEQMVCQDPSLAAADRRLARAFRRATDAGVPYEALRGEQDDWISIREAAARRSPEAVASIYDQRIEELEAMAEAPPDW